MDHVNSKPNTGDLLNTLNDPRIKYTDYLNYADKSFRDEKASEFWEEKRQKCVLNNSDIINLADIGYTYFYDIIAGKKKPSRDKLVRLAIAMGFTLNEVQKAMQIYLYSALYPRIKRDSILLFGINKKMTINDINELLIQNGEEALK